MKFNHSISFVVDIYKDYKVAVERTLEIAEGKHPNWELSCSREDQYLGDIGFTCTGYCREMYECDCDSYADRVTGKRIANANCAIYKCDVNGWYASEYSFTEAFVSDIKITELWMKERFFDRYTKRCHRLATADPADYNGWDRMYAEIKKLNETFERMGIQLKVV